ncbi:MAG: hypothetical protein QM490_01935 [Candidatus Gracilibacteria bacterium]
MIKFIKFIFNIILLPFNLVFGLIKLILSPLTAVLELILGLVMIGFLTYAYYNQETVIAEVKSIEITDVKEVVNSGIDTVKSIDINEIKEKYETIKELTNETNN